MDQYYWEENGDRYGAKSGFACVVRDDGTLAALAVEGMPVVEEAETDGPAAAHLEGDASALGRKTLFWPMSTLDEEVEKKYAVWRYRPIIPATRC